MQNQPPNYIPNVNELEGERPKGYVLEVIRADLPNAINAGLNQTQAFNAYVEAGLGPNYPAFRALYNEVKAQMSSEASANPNSPGLLPLTSDEVDFQRQALAGKSYYRYKEVFNAAIFDNNTGEIRNETLAYYHNEPMTVQELQAEALNYFNSEAVSTTSAKTVLSAALAESFTNQNFVTNVEK